VKCTGCNGRGGTLTTVLLLPEHRLRLRARRRQQAPSVVLTREAEMRLFGKTRRLPVTTYGYEPPPGATARGWRCADEQCGTGGDEVPRRWPFRCTACGAPADPEFDDPWAHDARGPWLRTQLAAAEQDRLRAFWESELIGWRYREALRVGDQDTAEATRADAHHFMSGMAGEAQSSLLFHIVHDSLHHNLLDAAAEDLGFWRVRTVTDGVDHDNARRTNCRQLLSEMLNFLEHPQAAQHPAAPGLRSAASELRDTIRDVLTVDLLRRTQHLDVDVFQPAAPYDPVPIDPVERLAAFGRYAFDPMRSDLDPQSVWSEIVGPNYETAVADPDQFCRQLAAVAIPAGGWAVYGAQRLVVELLGGAYRDHYFLTMQDAALDWLHARGVPTASLTGYEMARWNETHGAWTRGK
jgi:hypothetical protein